MAWSSYRDLVVWQKSMELTEEIYRLVKALPREETYGLSDQMRRAAVSVPSNIAEGHGRNSEKEFIRFLCMAKGSVFELETQIEICSRQGYFDREDLSKAVSLCTEVAKILTAMTVTTHNRKDTIH